MARPVLRATSTQIARAKLAYETSRANPLLPVERLTPSRHKGGDQGDTPWEALPLFAQESWVRVGDAVAQLAFEQAARLAAEKKTA
jgi:hypothetical protein